ncbi:hypothetical protein AAA315_03390 [Ruthenibacterium lactatiformans]|uniref:hypothetical protein n=1 Tax=Ruthenibacterium lactatiformans TaxID=1550024 RepID=UPI000A7DC156|nr:hypothetical protein [Ruthenibacterium lactatiformans]MBN3025668.1 hypothetical protein [Ruthenibacterium lactatiformans]MCQ5088611.1 hypothetical protein [Ruthenibacterium lactatiformans]
MVKKIEMKEKLLENFIPSFGKACRAAFMRGIVQQEKKAGQHSKGYAVLQDWNFYGAAF